MRKTRSSGTTRVTLGRFRSATANGDVFGTFVSQLTSSWWLATGHSRKLASTANWLFVFIFGEAVVKHLAAYDGVIFRIFLLL